MLILARMQRPGAHVPPVRYSSAVIVCHWLQLLENEDDGDDDIGGRVRTEELLRNLNLPVCFIKANFTGCFCGLQLLR